MSQSRSKKTVAGRLNPRKEPAQSRSAQTVDAILEGAAETLERRGFDGYTTNEIAARAGVSIGSLYQYFPGKDAVTIALIERESKALVDEITIALAVDDPGEALRLMIKAAVRNQLRRPKLARLLDFEEARLVGVLPPSRNAAAILRCLEDFIRRNYRVSVTASRLVAADVIEIARALTDAAGRREEVDADSLQRSIEAAVHGYLGEAVKSFAPAMRRAATSAGSKSSPVGLKDGS
jgi:AcrR family transcriptional regulator